MSCSHRHITNALAHLRRERCLRHPAAAVAFAGSAAPPGARASCPWRLDIHQPSKGFTRSYALKRNQKPPKIVELDETIDAKERTNPWADDTHTSRAAKLKPGRIIMDFLNSGLPPPDEMAFSRLRAQAGPEVLFDQSEPTSNTPWAQDSGIHALEGYTPDAEDIKFHFKTPRGWGFPPRRPLELSKQYLRDTCQCSKCVSPSSGRKTFATCDVPAVPRLRDPDTKSIRLKADGSLEITWEDDFLTGDEHTSAYPKDFLQRLVDNDGVTNYERRPRRLLWDKARFQDGMESRAVTFSDWMEGGAEFAEAVLNLYRHGLLFMRGVPKSRHSVQRIAERIGIVQSTIRGLTWDVISQPEAEHMTDDNRHLGLHQDLLYCHPRPRIKFLHCLENECDGGVSLFSDGLHAASVLESKDLPNYQALETQYVTYCYQRAGHYLESRRRVIGSGPDGHAQSVSWSPAFQGPFRVKEHQKILDLPTVWRGIRRELEAGPEAGTQRAWSRAAGAFRDILESPENVVQHRLQPGDCVIIDNKRVLHGRTEVDASAGLRHLRGAYVGEQALNSAFVDLSKKKLLTHSMVDGGFGPATSLYAQNTGDLSQINDLLPGQRPS